MDAIFVDNQDSESQTEKETERGKQATSDIDRTIGYQSYTTD